MSDLKKSDCVSVEAAIAELDVARNTLNAYMNVLNVPTHKFPLDRKAYISKTDLARVRKLIQENRG